MLLLHVPLPFSSQRFSWRLRFCNLFFLRGPSVPGQRVSARCIQKCKASGDIFYTSLPEGLPQPFGNTGIHHLTASEWLLGGPICHLKPARSPPATFRKHRNSPSHRLRMAARRPNLPFKTCQKPSRNPSRNPITYPSMVLNKIYWTPPQLSNNVEG